MIEGWRHFKPAGSRPMSQCSPQSHAAHSASATATAARLAPSRVRRLRQPPAERPAATWLEAPVTDRKAPVCVWEAPVYDREAPVFD